MILQAIQEVRLELGQKIDKLDQRVDKLDQRVDKIQKDVEYVKVKLMEHDQ
jgi:DNA repair exonuclease SbcCD ATPase subunit